MQRQRFAMRPKFEVISFFKVVLDRKDFLSQERLGKISK